MGLFDRRLAAPTAESESQVPSTAGLTDAEFRDLLASQYSDIATRLGLLQRLTDYLEDQIVVVPVANVAIGGGTTGRAAAAIQIPPGRWRQLYITPNIRLAADSHANSQAAIVALDQHYYHGSFFGAGVMIPVFNEATVTVSFDSTVAISAAWAVELVFTKREQPSGYLLG